MGHDGAELDVTARGSQIALEGEKGNGMRNQPEQREALLAEEESSEHKGERNHTSHITHRTSQYDKCIPRYQETVRAILGGVVNLNNHRGDIHSAMTPIHTKIKPRQI